MISTGIPVAKWHPTVQALKIYTAKHKHSAVARRLAATAACSDLWRLDLATWEWDELKSKKGPTARSGHRMVAHKGRLIMFGGYYDTGDEPRYYKDLWQFDVDALAWSPLGNMSEKWPPARSGFQFAMHGEELILQGGYSKHKSDDEEDMEHGQAFDDTWRLRLDTHQVLPLLRFRLCALRA